MTTFDNFKNNTELLKKYLQKMNLITQCEIKPVWIDEQFLRQNNPHIFLQILHYILIKFSPFALFIKVLDFYPTIKDDSDKKFVTNVIIISRKLFQIEAKIDIEQFLSQKFVQKKTEFTAALCKAAYDFHIKENKEIKGLNNGMNNESNFSRRQQDPVSIPSKIKYNRSPVDQDSEDEMPRNLNMAPSSTKRPIVNKMMLEKQSSSEDEDLKELLNKKKQLYKGKQKTQFSSNIEHKKDIASFKAKKPNIFPKQLEREQLQENQFMETVSNRKQIKKTLTKYNIPEKQPEPLPKTSQKTQNKNNPPKKVQNYDQSEEPQQQLDTNSYVTREQFMEIITGMTKNFTELLTKFNDFQGQVGGWVQNVNAKISILQENVKTIKKNL